MFRSAAILGAIVLIAGCDSGASLPTPPPTAPVPTNLSTPVGPPLSPGTPGPFVSVGTTPAPATPPVTPTPGPVVVASPSASPGCSPGGFAPNRPEAFVGNGALLADGNCAAPGGAAATRSCDDFMALLEASTPRTPDWCLIEQLLADMPKDPFAQDGLPLDGDPGFDIDFSFAIKPVGQWSDDTQLNWIREKCNSIFGNNVYAVCDPKKTPPANAQTTITWAHFTAPLPTDAHFSFGLYTRYDDTTPGRQAPDGFPLYIGTGAHVLFSSPIEADGSYDPPVYTDFRNNTGAFSPHIQLIGPDFFSFITFDGPASVRPYICQVGVPRPACDTTVSTQTEEDLKNTANWQQVVQPSGGG